MLLWPRIWTCTSIAKTAIAMVCAMNNAVSAMPTALEGEQSIRLKAGEAFLLSDGLGDSAGERSEFKEVTARLTAPIGAARGKAIIFSLFVENRGGSFQSSHPSQPFTHSASSCHSGLLSGFGGTAFSTTLWRLAVAGLSTDGTLLRAERENVVIPTLACCRILSVTHPSFLSFVRSPAEAAQDALHLDGQGLLSGLLSGLSGENFACLNHHGEVRQGRKFKLRQVFGFKLVSVIERQAVVGVILLRWIGNGLWMNPIVFVVPGTPSTLPQEVLLYLTHIHTPVKRSPAEAAQDALHLDGQGLLTLIRCGFSGGVGTLACDGAIGGEPLCHFGAIPTEPAVVCASHPAAFLGLSCAALFCVVAVGVRHAAIGMIAGDDVFVNPSNHCELLASCEATLTCTPVSRVSELYHNGK